MELSTILTGLLVLSVALVLVPGNVNGNTYADPDANGMYFFTLSVIEFSLFFFRYILFSFLSIFEWTKKICNVMRSKNIQEKSFSDVWNFWALFHGLVLYLLFFAYHMSSLFMGNVWNVFALQLQFGKESTK